MLHSVKETKHYGFALVLQASDFLIPKKFDLTGDVTNLYPTKATLYEKRDFALRISSVNVTKLQVTSDLYKFTEEVHNKKLQFMFIGKSF